MAIDFDAARVNDLFKDENKKELKGGITVRDINSVMGMTPANRSDLHEILQQAYSLISKIPQQIQAPPMTLAEQMAKMNGMGIKTLTEQMANMPTTVATPQDKIKELENLILEKNTLIETLTKERDDAINELYELEKQHTEKYKELYEKYESLKEEGNNVPSVVEDISDDLLNYMKDKLSRAEQKEALLNQEIGKLKGMLGL